MSNTSIKRVSYQEIIFFILAIIVCFLSTNYSVGISNDSFQYMGAAENFANGHGIMLGTSPGDLKPMTHWAPLYSVILGIFSKCGLDLLLAARLVNMFSFGIIILLANRMFNQVPSNPMRVLTCVYLTFSLTLISVGAMVLTECVFLMFTLAGLFLLVEYLDSDKKKFLIASAVLVAFGALTRYAGVATVGAGLFALVFFKKDEWSGRIKNAFLFGGISFVPFFLWSLRNRIALGSESTRELSNFPFHPGRLQNLSIVYQKWLIPQVDALVHLLQIHRLPILIGFVTFIFFLILKDRTKPVNKDDKTLLRIKVLSIFIICYVTLVALSMRFLDAAIPLDIRILSPVFLCGSIVFGLLCARTYNNFKNERGSFIISLVILVLSLHVYVLAYNGALLLDYKRQEGWTILSRSWTESKLMRAVRQLPENSLIYTNATSLIGIQTDQMIKAFPLKYDGATRNPNVRYNEEFERMLKMVNEQSGHIVFVFAYRKDYLTNLEDIYRAQSRWKRIDHDPSGVILYGGL